MDAFTFYNADNMNGMNSDSEAGKASASGARFAPNATMSPQQRANFFASNVRNIRGDSYLTGEQLEKQVYYGWMEGYYSGANDIAGKWQQYVAMQPPAPIVVERNEISLATYKMFILEKIKRDSKGSWWLTIKMWWRFIKL